MSDCLFCKIRDGDVPSTKLYEDDKVFAIKDINPQAEFHALIIPKKHIATLNDIEGEDTLLMGHLLQVAKTLTHKAGFGEGYRVLMNCGAKGGQVVFHIHLHVLANRDGL